MCVKNLYFQKKSPSLKGLKSFRAVGVEGTKMPPTCGLREQNGDRWDESAQPGHGGVILHWRHLFIYIFSLSKEGFIVTLDPLMQLLG